MAPMDEGVCVSRVEDIDMRKYVSITCVAPEMECRVIAVIVWMVQGEEK